MPRAARDPSQNLRLARFGAWVRRVLEEAGRELTVKEIEALAKTGKSTIYRWRDGESVPDADQLRNFCDGLAKFGASLAEANALLGRSEQTAARPKRDQLIDDPDMRRLLHKLTSPDTPAAEKLLIRRTIRALAAAPEEKHSEE